MCSVLCGCPNSLLGADPSYFLSRWLSDSIYSKAVFRDRTSDFFPFGWPGHQKESFSRCARSFGILHLNVPQYVSALLLDSGYSLQNRSEPLLFSSSSRRHPLIAIREYSSSNSSAPFSGIYNLRWDSRAVYSNFVPTILKILRKKKHKKEMQREYSNRDTRYVASPASRSATPNFSSSIRSS